MWVFFRKFWLVVYIRKIIWFQPQPEVFINYLFHREYETMYNYVLFNACQGLIMIFTQYILISFYFISTEQIFYCYVFLIVGFKQKVRQIEFSIGLKHYLIDREEFHWYRFVTFLIIWWKFWICKKNIGVQPI